MSKKYYVYLVQCQDSKGNISYYTGYTNNPQRRLKEHKIGKGAKYTAMRKVIGMAIIGLFYIEAEAMKTEKIIKKLGKEYKKVEYESNRKVEVE